MDGSTTIQQDSNAEWRKEAKGIVTIQLVVQHLNLIADAGKGFVLYLATHYKFLNHSPSLDPIVTVCRM